MTSRHPNVSTTRNDNSQYVKHVLSAAFKRANVDHKTIAAIIGTSDDKVWRMFSMDQSHIHMRVGDLYALANHPDSARFVKLVLAGFHSVIDPQELRVCDLEAMSHSELTTSIARMRLRPLLVKLFPELLKKTPGGDAA